MNDQEILYDDGEVVVTASPENESESSIASVYIIQGDTPYTVVLADRPFLTTEFEDFSVIEGFALLGIIIVFVVVIAKILKGAFRWLL